MNACGQLAQNERSGTIARPAATESDRTPILKRRKARSVLDDKSRLSALAETRLMDAAPAKSLDRYVHLLRRALNAPMAMICLVDDRRQFFANQSGLSGRWAEDRQSDLSESFCKHVVEDQDELVISDTSVHPRVRTNPAVKSMSIAAYVGVPIRSPDDMVLGSFCALDSEPRQWTDRELDLIRGIGEVVNQEIRMRRILSLARVSEDRMATQALSQEREIRILSQRMRYAQHDVRTPLAVLTSCIEALLHGIGIKPTTPPELPRMLRIMQRNVKHIVSITSQQTGYSVPAHSDAASVLSDVCEDLRRATKPSVRCVIEQEREFWVRVEYSDLRRCFENLVSNAMRFAETLVEASVAQEGSNVVMRVDDDGPGLPSDEAYEDVWLERVRLHAHTGQSGTGLGLAFVSSTISGAGGTVAAGPSPLLGGARFSICIPLAPPSKDRSTT